MADMKEGLGAPIAAPRINVNSNNQARVDAQPSQGQAQPQPQAIPQGQAPSLVQIMHAATVSSGSTLEGAAFNERVKNQVTQLAKDRQLEIKVISPNYPKGTTAFILGDKCIVTLLDECLPADTDNFNGMPTLRPTSRYSLEACKSISQILGKPVKLINELVVTPASYKRDAIFANQIINNLICQANPDVQALTVSNIANQNFEISNNPADFDSFLEMNYPHAVKPRADFTMVLSLASQHHNTRDFFSVGAGAKEPIMAAGGYVVFSRATDGTGQFIPEIHVSCIVSTIKSPSLLMGFFIEKIKEGLIDTRVWKTQFTHFGAEDVNVGHLIPLIGGQMFECKSVQEVEEFFVKNCKAPYLVLDIEHGKDWLPGMEIFSLPAMESSMYISNLVNSFFAPLTGAGYNGGQPILQPNQEFGTIIAKQYTGTVNTNDGPMDSRWLDCLTAMVHHGNDPAQCSKLLGHMSPEAARAEVIRSFNPSFKSLYAMDEVAIKPIVLNAIGAALAAANVRVISGVNYVGGPDLTGLQANYGFNGMSQMSGFNGFNSNFNQFWNQNGLFR